MHKALRSILLGLAVGIAFAALSLIPSLVDLSRGLGVELPSLVIPAAWAGAIGFVIGFMFGRSR